MCERLYTVFFCPPTIDRLSCCLIVIIFVVVVAVVLNLINIHTTRNYVYCRLFSSSWIVYYYFYDCCWFCFFGHHICIGHYFIDVAIIVVQKIPFIRNVQSTDFKLNWNWIESYRIESNRIVSSHQTILRNFIGKTTPYTITHHKITWTYIKNPHWQNGNKKQQQRKQ